MQQTNWDCPRSWNYADKLFFFFLLIFPCKHQIWVEVGGLSFSQAAEYACKTFNPLLWFMSAIPELTSLARYQGRGCVKDMRGPLEVEKHMPRQLLKVNVHIT